MSRWILGRSASRSPDSCWLRACASQVELWLIPMRFNWPERSWWMELGGLELTWSDGLRVPIWPHGFWVSRGTRRDPGSTSHQERRSQGSVSVEGDGFKLATPGLSAGPSLADGGRSHTFRSTAFRRPVCFTTSHLCGPNSPRSVPKSVPNTANTRSKKLATGPDCRRSCRQLSV